MTLLITPNNFLFLYNSYNKTKKNDKKDISNSKNYNTITYKNYKKEIINKDTRCGGIILNQHFNKVVIVLNRESMNRGEYKWGLPKGHINPNEKLNQCATREIEEETGLKINFNHNHPYIKINDTYYYIQIINDNQIKQFKPKDQNEISIVKWENINNIKNINTNRGLKKLHQFIPKIKKLTSYYHF